MKKPDTCNETIKNMPVGFHGKFCTLVNGERHTWFIQSLIKATKELPVVKVSLKELEEHLDENVWFHDDKEPTVLSIIKHYRRAEQVDLAFPIIISPKFGIMDGMHRIVKAHLTGCTTISAVHLVELPEADYIGDF